MEAASYRCGRPVARLWTLTMMDSLEHVMFRTGGPETDANNDGTPDACQEVSLVPAVSLVEHLEVLLHHLPVLRYNLKL